MRAFLVSADTFNGGSIHAYLVCRGPHEGHLSSVIERMQAALGKLNPRALPVLAVTPLTGGPRDRRGDRRAANAGDREEPMRAAGERTRDGRYATMWSWSVNNIDNRTLMALH